MARNCSVDGCDRIAEHKGWCDAHYRRQLTTGLVGGSRVRERSKQSLTCSVNGCTENSLAKNLCRKHYYRLKNSGTTELLPYNPPRGEAHPNYSGDAVGYLGAHRRVRVKYGLASQYNCACGKPAVEWAYTHDCPREMMEVRTDQRKGVTRPFPYSPDPDMYAPMCRSCHTSLDMIQANIRTKAALGEQ